MKLRNWLLPVCLLLLSSLCWGWPACSGNWNQVPAGTNNTNGAIYSADGITWQCQKPTPPSNPSSSSNTNSNSNSNTNTNNIKVNNTLSQTQKQNQNQSQNQSQTATGGNASSVSTASATGNGDGSNNTTSTTTVEASKIPVATAYAPMALPTVPCFKGFGAGVQTMSVGGSFGGGKIDKNCRILEVARSYGIAGAWVAYCKIMVTLPDSKAGGVTLNDCLARYVPPSPTIQALPDTVTMTTKQLTALIAPVVEITVTPAPVVTLPSPPQYRQSITVTAPKKLVKHLPPNCQNVIQTVCKEKTTNSK